jgi:LmbE family N-acetylglucosaminyl deacetylase
MELDRRLTRPALPEIWTAPPSGRALFVAPHPDDEVCGVGGILALHRLQGDPVHCLFLTDGINGDPQARHGDAAALARMRRAEASAAATRLGGVELAFLALPDDFEVTERDLRDVAAQLARRIEQIAPDILYVPWEGETHSDHRNARWAVDRAFEQGLQVPAWVLEYEVWTPLKAQVIVDISDVVALKRGAIEAHESQVAYTDYRHHILGLNAHRALYLPHGRTHGEALLVWKRP